MRDLILCLAVLSALACAPAKPKQIITGSWQDNSGASQRQDVALAQKSGSSTLWATTAPFQIQLGSGSSGEFNVVLEKTQLPTTDVSRAHCEFVTASQKVLNAAITSTTDLFSDTKLLSQNGTTATVHFVVVAVDDAVDEIQPGKSLTAHFWLDSDDGKSRAFEIDFAVNFI